ncbi:MAG TPA: GNAT family N-acetyltransferase [Candidatus Acidoferrum sp.]|nr:GNAT family N-acetyltransferase [Candidatus Acidoferrum sp.]
MRVIEACTEGEVAKARELFEEYWNSFGFTPCFQGFAEEVASLPGKYAAPGGTLGLLLMEGEVAGCVALRRFDETRGEFKRLYVRPAYRGMGLGRVLLDWVIGRARELGYRKLVADTMPQMEKALAMYDQAGFARTEAYAADPTPGAVYLEMTL